MSDIVFDRVARHFRRDGKDIPAVDDVSFEVRAREFVAIVGPSGCGKTTCLRMAAGLEFPEHNFVFTEQFTELLKGYRAGGAIKI